MIYPKIFERCIEIILKNEGGLVDHPSDPGGLTNMGITQRNYPLEDIKNLTKEKATAIYYRDYWLPMDLELLNNPDLILQIFDMGVNSGMRTSIKILQRLIGTIADGYIGQMTIRAIEDFNGDIVEEYIKRRKLFYVTLSQNKPELRKFLKGWLKRTEHTKF